MLVPLTWLKEYVDIDISPEELAAKLSASGSSVEHILKIGEGLDDLIVAKVLEVYPHPNADRLRLAKVNTGSETLEVVCGAPNLAAGQHVVFAPVGAHVPVNMHDEARQSFTLERATIRGVESNGMICSAAELGLGEEHGGILVLPDDTKTGQKVSEALNYPQVVFDIEITTNRADELSMIGLAREVSVLTKKPLKLPDIHKVQTDGGEARDPVIKSDACFRFVTQQLNVQVGPSPWWLQQYLTLSGMRPVNNVVDITNFVMLEYGQPMHAYDAAKLHGNTLITRQAEADERVITLDGVERELHSKMLVIADEKGPVGIAGIMGGQASKIEESTTIVTLEAAVFDPVSIRKTANALALRSEASRRFERGVDREQAEESLDRAVELLAKYASAKRFGPKRDAYPARISMRELTLTSTKLYQYLGKQIDVMDVHDILDSLGFSVGAALGKDADWTLHVRVPHWRLDVEGEEDLIEEVVRILGYDQVPVSLPSGQVPNQLLNQRYYRRMEVKRQLAQAGWMEVLTNSLTNEELERKAGRSGKGGGGREEADPDSNPSNPPTPSNPSAAPETRNPQAAASWQPETRAIAIANPLSSEWTHMRQSLLPGLLSVAQRNVRISPRLALFELSEVYMSQRNGLPDERIHLGMVLIDQTPPEASVTTLKGVVDLVLGRLANSSGVKYQATTEASGPFDPRNVAEIQLGNTLLGHIGALPASIQAAFDLPANTIVAELDVEDLLKRHEAKQFQPLPKFPTVEEDLSLLVDESTPVGPIVNSLIETGEGLVESIVVVDIYRNPTLGSNKKSPLLHIIYRVPDRTLSSQEVGHVRQKLIATLHQGGIDVRK